MERNIGCLCATSRKTCFLLKTDYKGVLEVTLKPVKGHLSPLIGLTPPSTLVKKYYSMDSKKLATFSPPRTFGIRIEHMENSKMCKFEMNCSAEERLDIAEGTVSQSNNQHWFNLRANRITASNAHRVITRMDTVSRDSNADVSSLLQALTSHRYKSFAAVAWDIQQESKARERKEEEFQLLKGKRDSLKGHERFAETVHHVL